MIAPSRLLIMILLLVGRIVPAQMDLGVAATSSGGTLLPEQAAYDVTFYDLALTVDPDSQTIRGALTMTACLLQPLEVLLLDLDDLLAVSQVELLTPDGAFTHADFTHQNGQIRVPLPLGIGAGVDLTARVFYGGHPRVAPYPPWIGGFVWDTTASGEPWVAVACQTDGADIWWPCKDHPSDEPDSMALHITVPAALTCASNGTLRDVTENDDDTRTFHWFVTSPINNYGVAVNIAPYHTLEGQYRSITGDSIPTFFWVLPEHLEQGRDLFQKFNVYLRYLEMQLGPYPFRAEKVGVTDTPFLGMEHQTIIAYGSRFRTNAYGFDPVLLHELVHEWYGNMLTCRDWKDMWLHEAFARYLEALYAESLNGENALHGYMAEMRGLIHNRKPVAPIESQTSRQIYFDPPEFTRTDGDIYNKGAWVLHTLRYLIGDEPFFQILRRMCYPDSSTEFSADGSQFRLVDTAEFERLVTEVSGMELGWFFDVYLRQHNLPELHAKHSRGKLRLRWKAPQRMPFPMPVEVQVGGKMLILVMDRGRAQLRYNSGNQPVIDPAGWILKREPPANGSNYR
jgi:aminopeptidase N